MHIKKQMDVSERRACEVIGQPGMTQRYKTKQPDKDKALTAEINRLAQRYKGNPTGSSCCWSQSKILCLWIIQLSNRPSSLCDASQEEFQTFCTVSFSASVE